MVASIFILIAPGLSWSYIFFKNDVSIIERMALSFGLSVVMVSLTLYTLNTFIGIRINLLNLVTTIGFIIIIPIIYKFMRIRK